MANSHQDKMEVDLDTQDIDQTPRYHQPGRRPFTPYTKPRVFSPKSSLKQRRAQVTSKSTEQSSQSNASCPESRRAKAVSKSYQGPFTPRETPRSSQGQIAQQNRVKVSVRVRPSSNIQEEHLRHSARKPLQIQYNSNTITIEKHVSTHFRFEKIFGPETDQQELYESSVAHLTSQVLSGQNSSVVAYGQTGSGKTYTLGFDSGQDALSGQSTTLVIACISCEQRDIEETKNTLLYAAKAQKIQKQPVLDQAKQKNSKQQNPVQKSQIDNIPLQVGQDLEKTFQILKNDQDLQQAQVASEVSKETENFSQQREEKTQINEAPIQDKSQNPEESDDFVVHFMNLQQNLKTWVQYGKLMQNMIQKKDTDLFAVTQNMVSNSEAMLEKDFVTILSHKQNNITTSRSSANIPRPKRPEKDKGKGLHLKSLDSMDSARQQENQSKVETQLPAQNTIVAEPESATKSNVPSKSSLHTRHHSAQSIQSAHKVQKLSKDVLMQYNVKKDQSVDRRIRSKSAVRDQQRFNQKKDVLSRGDSFISNDRGSEKIRSNKAVYQQKNYGVNNRPKVQRVYPQNSLTMKEIQNLETQKALDEQLTPRINMLKEINSPIAQKQRPYKSPDKQTRSARKHLVYDTRQQIDFLLQNEQDSDQSSSENENRLNSIRSQEEAIQNGAQLIRGASSMDSNLQTKTQTIKSLLQEGLQSKDMPSKLALQTPIEALQLNSFQSGINHLKQQEKIEGDRTQRSQQSPQQRQGRIKNSQNDGRQVDFSVRERSSNPNQDNNNLNRPDRQSLVTQASISENNRNSKIIDSNQDHKLQQRFTRASTSIDQSIDVEQQQLESDYRVQDQFGNLQTKDMSELSFRRFSSPNAQDSKKSKILNKSQLTSQQFQRQQQEQLDKLQQALQSFNNSTKQQKVLSASNLLQQQSQGSYKETLDKERAQLGQRDSVADPSSQRTYESPIQSKSTNSLSTERSQEETQQTEQQGNQKQFYKDDRQPERYRYGSPFFNEAKEPISLRKSDNNGSYDQITTKQLVSSLSSDLGISTNSLREKLLQKNPHNQSRDRLFRGGNSAHNARSMANSPQTLDSQKEYEESEWINTMEGNNHIQSNVKMSYNQQPFVNAKEDLYQRVRELKKERDNQLNREQGRQRESKQSSIPRGNQSYAQSARPFDDSNLDTQSSLASKENISRRQSKNPNVNLDLTKLGRPLKELNGHKPEKLRDVRQEQPSKQKSGNRGAKQLEDQKQPKIKEAQPSSARHAKVGDSIKKINKDRVSRKSDTARVQSKRSENKDRAGHKEVQIWDRESDTINGPQLSKIDRQQSWDDATIKPRYEQRQPKSNLKKNLGYSSDGSFRKVPKQANENASKVTQSFSVHSRPSNQSGESNRNIERQSIKSQSMKALSKPKKRDKSKIYQHQNKFTKSRESTQSLQVNHDITSQATIESLNTAVLSGVQDKQNQISEDDPDLRNYKGRRSFKKKGHDSNKSSKGQIFLKSISNKSIELPNKKKSDQRSNSIYKSFPNIQELDNYKSSAPNSPRVSKKPSFKLSNAIQQFKLKQGAKRLNNSQKNLQEQKHKVKTPEQKKNAPAQGSNLYSTNVDISQTNPHLFSVSESPRSGSRENDHLEEAGDLFMQEFVSHNVNLPSAKIDYRNQNDTQDKIDVNGSTSGSSLQSAEVPESQSEASDDSQRQNDVQTQQAIQSQALKSYIEIGFQENSSPSLNLRYLHSKGNDDFSQGSQSATQRSDSQGSISYRGARRNDIDSNVVVDRIKHNLQGEGQVETQELKPAYELRAQPSPQHACKPSKPFKDQRPRPKDFDSRPKNSPSQNLEFARKSARPIENDNASAASSHNQLPQLKIEKQRFQRVGSDRSLGVPRIALEQVEPLTARSSQHLQARINSSQRIQRQFMSSQFLVDKAKRHLDNLGHLAQQESYQVQAQMQHYVKNQQGFHTPFHRNHYRPQHGRPVDPSFYSSRSSSNKQSVPNPFFGYEQFHPFHHHGRDSLNFQHYQTFHNLNQIRHQAFYENQMFLNNFYPHHHPLHDFPHHHPLHVHDFPFPQNGFIL